MRHARPSQSKRGAARHRERGQRRAGRGSWGGGGSEAVACRLCSLHPAKPRWPLPAEPCQPLPDVQRRQLPQCRDGRWQQRRGGLSPQLRAQEQWEAVRHLSRYDNSDCKRQMQKLCSNSTWTIHALTWDLAVIEKWCKSAGLAPLCDFNICEA